jgi:hypothetical protein
MSMLMIQLGFVLGFALGFAWFRCAGSEKPAVKKKKK